MTVAMSQTDVIYLDSWALPDFELERQGWGIPPRESWQVDRQFRQTHAGHKSSTLFKRFNRHYLTITRHRGRKELPEQVIDLAFVEAEAREVRDFRARLWLLAACLLTIPVAFTGLMPVAPLWMLPPVLIAVALVAIALRLRKHHYEFRALNSDVVVFTVDAGVPAKDEADAFVRDLSLSIADAQRVLPAGKQRIPLAVAEMRRLAEQGIISKDDYEAIKRNWFRS